MPTIDFCDALSTIVPLKFSKTFLQVVAGPLGLRGLENLYQDITQAGGSTPIFSDLLERLQIRYSVSDKDISQFPRSGPAVVVANHPFGILDGAIIADLLLSLRADVKILANGTLERIPEIRDTLIPVNFVSEPSATARNLRGLRKAYRHVAAGGLLVVFPAGEVSHFQWSRRAVEDSRWNSVVARLARTLSSRNRNLIIVPVHFEGANSLLFQTVGMLHPSLRTVLLAREVMNKSGREVNVKVGTPIPSARLVEMSSDRERTEYLRWRTYILAHRNEFKAQTSRPMRTETHGSSPPAIAPQVPLKLLSDEVAALGPGSRLGASGELSVFVSAASRIPNILLEIGRLREVSFRAAGEGTGKPRDIDSFDARYQHLFIWNLRKQEVVGAYRLMGTDLMESGIGVSGLYTATLFNYSEQFLKEIGPALELGRSFIRPEYQRSFAPLLLLWKGIGQYVAEHPHYKILFGPVSISNTYQARSRELMVSWLEQHACPRMLKYLVSSKRLIRSKLEAPKNWVSSVDELSTIVEDIEPNRQGVPILLRQYLKLGGKLLAFSVDSKFSNALDGLILVDLTETNEKLLARYLGATQAAAFRKFHKK